MKRYCTINQGTTTNQGANNGLCKQCNMNESLKISKLSDYVPKNERNYEYEIKKFKDSLEQQYPLCAKCKSTVNNVLYKQSLWLAQYKMLLFKQKPFCIIANVSIVIKYITTNNKVCMAFLTVIVSFFAEFKIFRTNMQNNFNHIRIYGSV